MTGVERVKVHLALEDDKLFKKDTRESKASVTLAMQRRRDRRPRPPCGALRAWWPAPWAGSTRSTW